MSNFILTFRGATDRVASEADGAAWMAWFEELGAAIADPGSQVGNTTALGVSPSSTAINGYSIIQAADFDTAVALANGCPGIVQGGGVEIGELIAM